MCVLVLQPVLLPMVHVVICVFFFCHNGKHQKNLAGEKCFLPAMASKKKVVLARTEETHLLWFFVSQIVTAGNHHHTDTPVIHILLHHFYNPCHAMC